ncbi:MAG: DUF1161 domain-containing protein [Proteobacteria bacterium]|nr:DUF1161 domain-containing protein [Pseudomonadota bacterium]
MKTFYRLAAAALLACSAAAGHAQGASCEDIRAQIDAKVRASGVNDFSLSILDADAPSTGRVVGSCQMGTRKIVYDRSASAQQQQPEQAPQQQQRPRPKSSSPIITECKDGSVSMGGDCKP